MSDGFVEFEFNLPDALLQHLVSIFDSMPSAQLTATNVAELPDAQGVYQLLVGGEVVYIGKTDGEAGLRKRLGRHAFTIQHRLNLSVADVLYKAVRVFVFTAIDLETQLIRHYGKKTPVAWNNSGFGSNDPGRRRDTTELDPEGFDARYPLDIDVPLDLELPNGATLLSSLILIRNAVPYYFRWQGKAPRSRQPHPEIDGATFSAPTLKRPTMRQAIEAVLSSLPPGWQATMLAGRVILYSEVQDYEHGSVIGRSV